jgi:hypothetical protein
MGIQATASLYFTHNSNSTMDIYLEMCHNHVEYRSSLALLRQHTALLTTLDYITHKHRHNLRYQHHLERLSGAPYTPSWCQWKCLPVSSLLASSANTCPEI